MQIGADWYHRLEITDPPIPRRYVHLDRDDLGPGDRLVSEQARTILAEEVPELDYLSQVVFCMYENRRVPIDDPRRFRVEILFSPGGWHCPACRSTVDVENDCRQWATLSASSMRARNQQDPLR